MKLVKVEMLNDFFGQIATNGSYFYLHCFSHTPSAVTCPSTTNQRVQKHDCRKGNGLP